MHWGIAYHRAPDGSIPAGDFLASCPTKVAANIFAVLEAVRTAPPPAFSGGGKWEAMHGTMAGYYEIRGTGPGRRVHGGAAIAIAEWQSGRGTGGASSHPELR